MYFIAIFDVFVVNGSTFWEKNAKAAQMHGVTRGRTICAGCDPYGCRCTKQQETKCTGLDPWEGNVHGFQPVGSLEAKQAEVQFTRGNPRVFQVQK